MGKARERLERAGVVVRDLRMEDFEEELRAIHGLSLVAFANNFLYTPIGEEEFVGMYEAVREAVAPRFVKLAEADGELAGFAFALPDAGGDARTLVMKTLAARPERRFGGLGALLMEESLSSAREAGMTRCVHALQHEGNSSLRTGDGMPGGDPAVCCLFKVLAFCMILGDDFLAKRKAMATTTKSSVQVRLDKDLKEAAEVVFANIGVDSPDRDPDVFQEGCGHAGDPVRPGGEPLCFHGRGRAGNPAGGQGVPRSCPDGCGDKNTLGDTEVSGFLETVGHGASFQKELHEVLPEAVRAREGQGG